MRFNERVTIIRKLEGEYNPILGEYEEGKVDLVTLPCFSMELKTEASIQVFGDYKVGRRVLIFQNAVVPFLYCEYKKEIYRVVADKLDNRVFYMECDSSVCKN